MICSRRISLPLAFLSLIAATTFGDDKKKQNAEKPDQARLTLERIYSSSEFSSAGFNARWQAEGATYEKLEESELTSGDRDIVQYDAATGARSVVVPASLLVPTDATSPLVIDGYTWSKDRSQVLVYTNSKRVWRRNTRGDYWILDRSSHELRQLGGNARPSTLMFATISPVGDKVAYVRANDIYVEDLRSHEITRLTHSNSPDVINGTFDWVYEEELGLRNGFRWSPDGTKIAYWQIDSHGVRAVTLINNTSGLYPKTIEIKYPKTGQQNSVCRIAVISAHGGKPMWMTIPGDQRDHYVARMDWAGNSKELVLQQLNRRQNTNRVMLAATDTGKTKVILTERDAAWVDVHNEMFWTNDAHHFTWISQRDGWRHAYLAARSGAVTKLVTPGEFDVVALLHHDENAATTYFIASPKNPSQRYLYRAKIGQRPERLTPADQPGTHTYRFSPNGKFAIHSYSSFDHPPVTNLVRVNDHHSVRVLADNKKLKENIKKLRRQPAEFLRVDIGNGVQLDGWCIKPPKMKKNKKYPLLVYVYGEPAGQTVLDRWGGSRYLWHLMLAQQGYVVMSFDNRGTPAPRGREWRKSVYRKVGIVAPQDQAAAVRKVLSDRPYLDPDRVGVWGWSGGGSMTLNAMFKYPELYKTGLSVAPVPNMRYYDTIYQERYMGLPSDNADGYVQGSPINFAHQLKGNLLLVHGTGDDNCHYQTTELLINELIRHNRPFTMMAYPNRTHSIREGKNTTRHLMELMTSYLHSNLPAGPRK
jgi:dipeptidyl-peptidase-4